MAPQNSGSEDSTFQPPLPKKSLLLYSTMFDPKLLNTVRAVQHPSTTPLDSKGLSSLTTDSILNDPAPVVSLHSIPPVSDVEGPVITDHKDARSVRITDMPADARDQAYRHDADGDGTLSAEEVAQAILELSQKNQENGNLRRTIYAFVAVVAVLVATVFGASLAASRLSREISVDHRSGFAYARGPSPGVIKTSDATVYTRGVSIHELSNAELQSLREINLHDGSLRFAVKGHARNELDGSVILLVEGGTLTFDATDCLVDAEGPGRTLLAAVYGASALACDADLVVGTRAGTPYHTWEQEAAEEENAAYWRQRAQQTDDWAPIEGMHY